MTLRRPTLLAWMTFCLAVLATLSIARRAEALPGGYPGISESGGCSAGGSCHNQGGVVSGVPKWGVDAHFDAPSGGGANFVDGDWYVDPNTVVDMSFYMDATQCAFKGYDIQNSSSGSSGTFQTTGCSSNSTCTATDVTHNSKFPDPFGGTETMGCGPKHATFRWRSPNAPCVTSVLVAWANTIVDPPNFQNNIAVKTTLTIKTKCGNGVGCGGPGRCVSNNCVDGNCCNTPCSGECQKCGGGVCAFTSGAKRNGLACGGTSPCNGSCTGSSTSCVFPGGGTVCLGGTCVSGTATSPAFCNGGGGCGGTTTSSCGAFSCNPAGTACGTSCASDSECTSDRYCAAPLCVPKNPNGTACAAGNQCTSGFCVDGVCCNTDCTGQCSSCNGTSPGSCSAVTGPPTGGRVACDTDGISTCGGQCNGVLQTACTYPTGECRGATCESGVATLSASCDGKGNCPLTETKSCAPFACTGTTCATTCTGDSDCAGASYCKGGVCAPKSLVGDGCFTNGECSSGFCVDGVCCNTSCLGQCEACDVLAKVGTCVPIAEAPHGTRTACAAGTDGCPSACDGTTTAICTPASCDAGADAAPDASTDDTTATEGGGDDAGGAGDAIGLPDAVRSDTSTGPGEPNENNDCACRAAGRPTEAWGLALFGLGLGVVVARRRRQH